MNCPLELARPLAYWLVTFGCVLPLGVALGKLLSRMQSSGLHSD